MDRIKALMKGYCKTDKNNIIIVGLHLIQFQTQWDVLFSVSPTGFPKQRKSKRKRSRRDQAQACPVDNNIGA